MGAFSPVGRTAGVPTKRPNTGRHRTPGLRLNAEPSAQVESRWFYPRITAGQDYTIPANSALSFDGTTWLTAGDRVWPASKKCKVRATASPGPDVVLTFNLVFNGVTVPWILSTGGGNGLPGEGLAFLALAADGWVDVIGLSVADYDRVEPTLRPIFFIDKITLRPTADAIDLALASPLLNTWSMLGTESEDRLLLYVYDTPESIISKAFQYVKEVDIWNGFMATANRFEDGSIYQFEDGSVFSDWTL